MNPGGRGHKRSIDPPHMKVLDTFFCCFRGFTVKCRQAFVGLPKSKGVEFNLSKQDFVGLPKSKGVEFSLSKSGFYEACFFLLLPFSFFLFLVGVGGGGGGRAKGAGERWGKAGVHPLSYISYLILTILLFGIN